jgi:hypothetical protein
MDHPKRMAPARRASAIMNAAMPSIDRTAALLDMTLLLRIEMRD